MSTTPTPEGVSDEQIIELAYQHLCYWNEDHIRFARAVLALSSSARDQEGVRYEREAYRVFMDGNQWCAVGPAFIDLQQSLAGFADTPYLALERLTEAEGEDMRRALRAADWKDAPAPIPEAPAGLSEWAIGPDGKPEDMGIPEAPAQTVDAIQWARRCGAGVATSEETGEVFVVQFDRDSWPRFAAMFDAPTPTEARDAPTPIERCKCGYPMPCSKTVPIGFCRAGLPGDDDTGESGK